ncbi:YfhO family protein [Falsibacillus pallidus]|uniref:YfhO family protein n=1 Tax=Falsibacillus pallidus TaxID=493781 RepID=UPI003D974718
MLHKLKLYVFPAFLMLSAALGMHLYFFMSGALFSPTGRDTVEQYLIFHDYLHHAFRDGHFFWSWNYGLGGDLFGQFIYYYSTSIYFWLSLCFDVHSLKDLIDIKFYISIFKSFLAMQFFFLLLRSQSRSILSSLAGALVYVGSVMFLRYNFFSDFMTDAMVWLPLAILGLHLLFERKNPYPFLISIMVIVSSNFYFAFINSVYIFLYGGIYYFLHNRSPRWKNFFLHYLRITKIYMIGFLMGAFSFLPAVYQFLHADRFGKKIEIPLLFQADFYKGMVFNLFVHTSTITVPIACLLLILIGSRIKEREIRIRFYFTLFFIVLYGIPEVYSFFNGFSAIQYRWLYLFIFTVALFIPYVLDWVSEEKKSFPIFTSITAVALGICFFKKLSTPNEVDGSHIFYIALFMMSFVLLVLVKKIPTNVLKGTFLTLILINIIWTNYYSFKMELGSFKEARASGDKVFGPTGVDNKAAQRIIDYIHNRDSSFYRIMWADNLFTGHHNAQLLYRYNGFSAYQSLIPYNVSRFLKEHYSVLQMDSPSQFKNLDGRTFLENMLGTKYYVVPPGSSYTPYGYKKINDLNGYSIYENKNSLPVGFMYEEGIDENTFNTLNAAEKDQLLLAGAVTEEAPEKLGMKNFNLDQLQTMVLHDGLVGTTLQNVKYDGDWLAAGKKATIVIPLSAPASKLAGEFLTEFNIESKNGDGFTVSINGKTLIKRDSSEPYSLPQTHFVMNLGTHLYKNTVYISLSPGKYKISSLQVLFNSLDTLQKRTSERKAIALKDIQYGPENLQGTIHSENGGLLYMSIPYSKGWKVKVDGKEVKPIETNFAFIGVPITRGDHKVELTYVTPYFKIGLSISLITLLACIVYYLYKRNKTISKNEGDSLHNSTKPGT